MCWELGLTAHPGKPIGIWTAKEIRILSRVSFKQLVSPGKRGWNMLALG
jgi:hypothetical protein